MRKNENVCVCVHQSEGKRERVVWGKKKPTENG